MHTNSGMPPPLGAAERSVVAANVDDNGKWVERLLRDCACAISEKDSAKTHHLLWMLNELAAPYGDASERLAAHFLRALLCKATYTGARVYKTLVSVSEKAHTFDSARKVMLKFQEVSPWTTFGHVAANGTILEATDGAAKIHIIDISNTFCTQWPTLLEALATRHDDTPHLKLTVVTATVSSAVKSLKNEIAQRLEKFARLMGVPFEFNVVTGISRLGEITKENLNVQDDESVAVNVAGALRRVGRRAEALRAIRSLNPKIVTVVEEEAVAVTESDDFVGRFEECLGFYRRYFGMLEECFPATSNERLALEREGSRSILRAVGWDDMAEEDGGECERRERGGRWSGRLREAGFTAVALSDDTVDDVKALLKRYKGEWGAQRDPQHDDVITNSSSSSSGILLTWKDEPVVWASAWKP